MATHLGLRLPRGAGGQPISQAPSAGDVSGWVDQQVADCSPKPEERRFDQTGWLTVDLHGPDGRIDFDLTSRSPAEMATALASAQRTIVDEFVACVRSGAAHALDARRGLMLQRLVDAAATQLRRPGRR